MSSSNRAVSPVVAVILLVAVTVTLSAVIGGVALDLGQSLDGTSTQNDVSTKTTYEEDGNATIQVITGNADELQALVNGNVSGSLTDAQPGDTLTVSASQTDSLTIVATTDGERTIVSSSDESPTATTVAAPTNGIFAHYTLNNTTADEEGNPSLSLAGDATFTTTSRGDALTLDGSGDYADAPEFNNRTSATFAGWFKTTKDGVEGRTTLNAQNPAFTLRFHDNGATDALRVYVGGVNDNGDINITHDLSNWNHVVVTAVENDTMTVYINGTKVGNDSVGELYRFGNQYNNVIGASRGQTYEFTGHISDARLYNHSLNDSEVSDLYNATK